MRKVQNFNQFNKEQDRILESASKNAAEVAEALLDLASEYADIKHEEIRPTLFTEKSEALDLVVAAVSALEGAEVANKFKIKAKELLGL